MKLFFTLLWLIFLIRQESIGALKIEYPVGACVRQTLSSQMVVQSRENGGFGKEDLLVVLDLTLLKKGAKGLDFCCVLRRVFMQRQVQLSQEELLCETFDTNDPRTFSSHDEEGLRFSQRIEVNPMRKWIAAPVYFHVDPLGKVSMHRWSKQYVSAPGTLGALQTLLFTLGFQDQFALLGEELFLGKTIEHLEEEGPFGDEGLDKEEIKALFTVTEDGSEWVGVDCTRTVDGEEAYPLRTLRWNPSCGLLFQLKDGMVSTIEQDPYFDNKLEIRITSESIAPRRAL